MNKDPYPSSIRTDTFSGSCPGRMKRHALLFTLVPVIMALALCGCSPREEVRQMSGETWGTTYHITYTSSKDLSARAIAEMRLVDSTLSMFNPASEVSRVNATESPVRVSEPFREVFAVSAEVSRLSSGAFDPTVAPLVDFWGFGRRKAAEAIPDTALLPGLLERVGISGCSLSPDGTLTKKHPLTEFDFSAVAKGYGVDRIASALAREGVKDYMVEVGGEIALSGLNPRGEPWHIQIDAPVVADTLTHRRLTVLELSDCCIATSGNYRRWLDTPGGRIGHTISPLTGRPVPSPTLSATVIAPTCAMADALATACMALPPDKAMEMIDRLPGVAAMLVTGSDVPGEDFALLTSKNWSKKQ